MARERLRAAGLLLLGGSLVAVLAGQAPGGSLHQVAMKAADYAPKRVTVRVGDTVEWTNEDVVAHTATVKGSFDVNVLPRRTPHHPEDARHLHLHLPLPPQHARRDRRRAVRREQIRAPKREARANPLP